MCRMTKDNDFKRRFAAVLQDLQQDGTKDPAAMMLLGGLASDLARDFKAQDWSQAKQSLNAENYDGLLKTFQSEGNALHAAGQEKHAYAIQALAVSLIAITQRADPDMVAGENLLDAIINRAVAVYRSQSKPN
jgi:hypothetical protein